MAIEIPNMIQIGSTGRNSGKTTLAEALIKQYQEVYPIYGLKIITISGQRGVCQRGTKEAVYYLEHDFLKQTKDPSVITLFEQLDSWLKER